MLEVVVLPCVPVTAIVGRRRVSSPSRSARCSSAPRSRAARSGLSAGIALETTTSAPAGTLAAAWPTARLDPGGAGAWRRTASRARGPSPVTLAPSAWATSARPLIPAPPIPTKCSRRPVHGIAHAPGSLAAVSRRAGSGQNPRGGGRPDRARRARGIRLRRAAPRTARGHRGGARGPRHARRHVDRIGQVGDLPDRGPPAAGRDARDLPAAGAPARAGRATCARTRPAARRRSAPPSAGRSAPRRWPSWPRMRWSSSSSPPSSSRSRTLLDELAIAGPSLMVVDEAHCISEWGHDFRPDYLRLGAVVEALGRPTVLALTATAAPPVRDEIVARLGLRDALVLTRGFDRPEIRLCVERHQARGPQAAGAARARGGAPSRRGSSTSPPGAAPRSLPRRCATTGCARPRTTRGCGATTARTRRRASWTTTST